MTASKPANYLILGATGGSGLAFIKEALLESPVPHITALIRTPSKFPEEYSSHPDITIVQGNLDDPVALKKAFGNGVTAVISFLGQYVSLSGFLLRPSSTPISDAFPILFEVMREMRVRRILALSTPGAFPQEQDSFSLARSAVSWMPKIVVPQGHAEMVGIGNAVGGLGNEFEWTVFRVPMLNDGDAGLTVEAGYLGEQYLGGFELSRGSQARWVLRELEKGEWIGSAPVLGNTAY